MTLKKLLLTTSLLLFIINPFGSWAQENNIPVDEETGLITYQEVVTEEGNKESFFDRSIKWINAYYSNPVDVTKTRDPESGMVKGMHRIRLKNVLDDGVQADAGTVQYRFSLEFKEGRYRYTLTEFELRQASKVPCENWLTSTDPQSKSYLKQIDEFAQSWIASLKEGMMPEVEKKEDEW
jgi:hypothetical protein